MIAERYKVRIKKVLPNKRSVLYGLIGIAAGLVVPLEIGLSALFWSFVVAGLIDQWSWWLEDTLGGGTEMPIATTSDKPERIDLKSLVGAYIEVRRMDHGAKMARQKFMNKASFKGQRGSKDISVDFEVVNSAATMYTWRYCIVDHNLEYLTDPNNPDSVAKLDFSKPEHVNMVDGRVSEEINTLLEEMNNFDLEEEDGKGGNS